MSRQFSTLAEELGIERDENLVAALQRLSARKMPLEDAPEGKLRIGNLLILAKAASCHEVAYHIRICFEALGGRKLWQDSYFYVGDELIEEVARSMEATGVSVLDSFNDELQVVTDLAHAAGLDLEVEWLERTWSVHPSPSVTAPLATR